MLIKKRITQKMYTSPRMSIKLLCEYVSSSSPSRRSTIIKDSCMVPTYIAKRYNLATEAIVNHLANPTSTLKSLMDEIVRLKTKEYSSSYEKEMSLLSIQAIESFAKHASSFKKVLGEFKVQRSNHFNYHKMLIEGVEISIRPELIIINPINNGIVGFIKLYFAKNQNLDPESAALITCLGRNYFNENHSLNMLQKNCFVLDAFKGESFNAPKASKKRMSDIAAACREIDDRWARFTN